MLIDNKKNGRVGDVVKGHIEQGSKLSVISGYFTIYAFKELQKEFVKIDELRLLFNKPIYQESEKSAHILSGEKAEKKFENVLNQAQIARECAKWFQEKVKIREMKQSGMLPFSLYHIKNSHEDIAIQGSSNFSSIGLGYTHTSSMHMNTLFKDSESVNKLLSTFDEIWQNSDLVRDIKEELLQDLETLYKDQTPEFIYFLTLYNIFKDFIGELEEEKIIKSKTGFKETLIWKRLYTFQKDGVLGAIDKLEKYNGCIIADSVGLGKTFEALAVIKYYELRNNKVLVLCPKKLRENWTLYTINDRRNILSNDRFNYDVLNHSDLTREKGMSGEINLATINWENYDLIVIDESHNFRNTSTNKKKNKSRYSKLLDDILKKGVKTKVLMLSATPVNNRLNDLKNQIAFITEAEDNAFEESGIKSIENTLRRAQTKFSIWLKEDEKRDTKKLLDMLNFDYFKLLDLVTIARSRKHIEKYYDIDEIGKFPERKKPINLKSDIDIDRKFPPLLEINRTIRKLNLSAYAPLRYLYPDRREEYDKKYDIQMKGGSVFKQIDREQSLIHLMRVNLLKRMESSINSFALTVKKLIEKNEVLIKMLEESDGDIIEDISIVDIDIDSKEYASQLIGSRVKVLIKDIDRIRWKQDLEADIYKLKELYSEAIKIDAKRDEKLQTLKSSILEKVQNPFNPNNKKVIVFTAFADTAKYLYEHIASWAKEELFLESALITGGGRNKTTITTGYNDLNSLLTYFSPISKELEKTPLEKDKTIDILIATDCISEGQNLQDCDYLVNYDIHWNPVRIIQRFGRIDRLGSQNSAIQLVNFWPNMELDEYIDLESRVSGRMVLLDVSATGEENIIDTSNKEMNDLSYRAKQLKELQNSVIDLEDVSGSVSITDMTLNDFRMDLMEYLKEHKGVLERSPLALYGVVSNDSAYLKEKIGTGTIYCLKYLGEEIHQTHYSLEPYYLVFVDERNNIKYAYSHAKAILDIYKKLCLGNRNVVKEAVELFEKQTNQHADISYLQEGLRVAVESIIGKKEENGLNSLFSRGGTMIANSSFEGMESFELISYLVIL